MARDTGTILITVTSPFRPRFLPTTDRRSCRPIHEQATLRRSSGEHVRLFPEGTLLVHSYHSRKTGSMI